MGVIQIDFHRSGGRKMSEKSVSQPAVTEGTVSLTLDDRGAIFHDLKQHKVFDYMKRGIIMYILLQFGGNIFS